MTSGNPTDPKAQLPSAPVPGAAVPGASVANAEVSASTPAATPKALLEVRQMTFSEHLFVWALIIIVGVGFGAAGSLPLLMQGSQDKILPGQVALSEIQSFLSVDARIPNPRLGDDRQRLSDQDLTERVRSMLALAKTAKAKGLQPSGAELDRLLSDYLRAPIRFNSGLTIGQYLESITGPQRVQIPELRNYLAVCRAHDALVTTALISPAIPQTAASAAARIFDRQNYQGQPPLPADRLQVTAVELTAQASASASVISDNDPAVSALYQSLKDSRYRIPASAMVQVAYLDRAAASAAALATISDAQVGERYAQLKEVRFRLPTPSGSAAMYRELDATLRNELRGELAAIAATARAEAATHELEAKVETESLDKRDAAAFAASASASGLRIALLRVHETKQGEALMVGDFGTIDAKARVWDQQVNDISVATLTSNQTWVVVRMHERFSASVKPLDQVSDEVKRMVAAQRAWSDLRQSALDMQRSAASAGKGGLAGIAKAVEHQRWAPTVTTMQFAPFSKLVAPAQAAPGPGTDSVPAAALAVNGWPVVLQFVQTPVGEPPRIRLLQLDAYQSAPAPTSSDIAMFTSMYARGLVQRFREAAVSDELLK